MYTKTILEHFLDWLTEYKQLEPDEEKGIYYPNKKQIISLHDYLIKNFRYEGEPVNNGLLSDGVLDFTGLKYYEKIVSTLFGSTINGNKFDHPNVNPNTSKTKTINPKIKKTGSSPIPIFSQNPDPKK